MKTVRRLFVVIFCLAVVATGVVLWGDPVKQKIGDWLVYDSGCSGEPQVAALLMGSINSRPKAAATWLMQHPTTQLFFARSRDEELQYVGLVPNEGPLTKSLLAIYGIAGGRVTVLPEPQVANTYEEMRRLVAYAESLTPRPRELYILTSWSHSRRAAWTAEHVAQDTLKICLVPLRQGEDSPVSWWKTDRGTLDVFSEYIKSLRYGLKYAGRSPAD